MEEVGADPAFSFLLPSFFSTQSATAPPPYTQESLIEAALKLSTLHSQHPQPSTSSLTTIQNACLLAATTRFPDASIPYLRDLITTATAALESAGLVITNPTLDGMVSEMLLLDKDKYPKRISTDPPKRDEYFRSQDYARAAKLLLYNEFPMHYKQTIKSILLDTNSSYLHARTLLLITPPPKIWSLFTFTARPSQPIPHHLSHHPEITLDKQEIAAESMKSLCESDETLSKTLNLEEYTREGQLLECPVCIDDLAFEDFAACTSGCLVCKTCLGRYVRGGVYESGELRGKAVTCFLETDVGKCGAGYSDEVLERAVGKDVCKVMVGLVNERIVREAFGVDGCVCCAVCGYAEARDPKETPSKFSLACGEMLLVLLWLEAKGEQIRHHRYSDPVILISILALFEFIMVTFFISIVLGVVAVVLLRFFLELSGLWRQPLELVFEMVRMDPVVLVQLNSMPPSAAVVYVQTGYKSIKTLLEQYSLTHPKFIKKQRPLPFNCKNPTCLLSSCRECGKEWTACHVCHEAEKDSLRLYVEQAMSEAFIRTCPNCRTRYTKQSGCNKMTCPMCKFVMCYVCRQDIGREGYEHFCQHFRMIPGIACTECQKCDLYVTKEDEAHLKRVADAAEKEWRARHPQAAVRLTAGKRTIVSPAKKDE